MNVIPSVKVEKGRSASSMDYVKAITVYHSLDKRI